MAAASVGGGWRPQQRDRQRSAAVTSIELAKYAKHVPKICQKYAEICEQLDAKLKKLNMQKIKTQYAEIAAEYAKNAQICKNCDKNMPAAKICSFGP